MKQNNVKEAHNIYRCCGFECSGGW